MRTFAIAVLLTSLSVPGSAQERDRSKIADKYKWNLADLYPSDEAWRAAKDKLPPLVQKVASFKGTLGTSPARLADALDAANAAAKELQKVYLYASLISDQDTRVAKYQGMQQEMQQVGAEFGEQVAFIEPEVLKIDKATNAVTASDTSAGWPNARPPTRTTAWATITRTAGATAARTAVTIVVSPALT